MGTLFKSHMELSFHLKNVKYLKYSERVDIGEDIYDGILHAIGIEGKHPLPDKTRKVLVDFLLVKDITEMRNTIRELISIDPVFSRYFSKSTKVPRDLGNLIRQLHEHMQVCLQRGILNLSLKISSNTAIEFYNLKLYTFEGVAKWLK